MTEKHSSETSSKHETTQAGPPPAQPGTPTTPTKEVATTDKAAAQQPKPAAPPPEPVVFNANGNQLSMQMADRIKTEIQTLQNPPVPQTVPPTAPQSVTSVHMSMLQWKGLADGYANVEPLPAGLDLVNKVYGGYNVTIDPKVPRSEVWFEAADGTVLGKITGLT